jgi:hypothetical protein
MRRKNQENLSGEFSGPFKPPLEGRPLGGTDPRHLVNG